MVHRSFYVRACSDTEQWPSLCGVPDPPAVHVPPHRLSGQAAKPHTLPAAFIRFVSRLRPRRYTARVSPEQRDPLASFSRIFLMILPEADYRIAYVFPGENILPEKDVSKVEKWHKNVA